jgi:peptidoglycan hydrolase-like protein with peptidoglycan-binding domain
MSLGGEDSINILWQGARGLIVKDLQTRLKKCGFNPGDIDGIFGPSTTAALTAFQKDRKIFADGIAGPLTFKLLKFPLTAPAAPRPTRTKVFVSYSHADEKWLQMLQVHLAPLERSGLISLWDDTKILPGKKWREEIAAAIRSAKAAVLLISADFIASEFIANNELPPLLETAEKEKIVILPVNISPVHDG